MALDIVPCLGLHHSPQPLQHLLTLAQPVHCAAMRPPAARPAPRPLVEPLQLLHALAQLVHSAALRPHVARHSFHPLPLEVQEGLDQIAVL